MPNRTRDLVLVSFWLALIVIGWQFLLNYEKTPANCKQPCLTWPSESKMKRSQTAKTLVMFAHPQCPCTMASLRELARLSTEQTIKTYVCFMIPKDADKSWLDSRNQTQAKSMPGIKVWQDTASTEASLFQASTSGESMLFDENGKLIFRGGITGSRGHEGDNEGLEQLRKIINSKTGRGNYVVYGCPLAEARTSKAR